MDHWLELKHRKEAHTTEAGVRGLGWLQEEVTLPEVHLWTNVVYSFLTPAQVYLAQHYTFLSYVFLLHSEPAAKVMVELLGSYTEDNASQARVDAHR